MRKNICHLDKQKGTMAMLRQSSHCSVCESPFSSAPCRKGRYLIPIKVAFNAFHWCWAICYQICSTYILKQVFLIPELCTISKLIFTHYHLKNIESLHDRKLFHLSHLDHYLGEKTPSFKKKREIRGDLEKIENLRRAQMLVCRINWDNDAMTSYPFLPISFIPISLHSYIFYLIVSLVLTFFTCLFDSNFKTLLHCFISLLHPHLY